MTTHNWTPLNSNSPCFTKMKPTIGWDVVTTKISQSKLFCNLRTQHPLHLTKYFVGVLLTSIPLKKYYFFCIFLTIEKWTQLRKDCRRCKPQSWAKQGRGQMGRKRGDQNKQRQLSRSQLLEVEKRRARSNQTPKQILSLRKKISRTPPQIQTKGQNWPLCMYTYPWPQPNITHNTTPLGYYFYLLFLFVVCS